jgi:single-stranded-DNA-specific exonuclease
MWQVRPVDSQQVAQLANELGVTPTTARLLWLRGFTTADAARPFWEGRDDLSFLKTPITTPAMQKAVERLKRAFAAQEPITIYGDYDCDGVTSSALLYRYLKGGPKANVQAYLPDRFLDGYGINANAVRRLHAEGCKVILTCDNGVSAVEAASVAKELGIDLIVTDHHHVPEVLPDAYALVHPQLEFPHLKDLSGVGVALLLVIALEGGWNERLRSMLDLVALGSVADVVPLNGPNRALVWAGLQHIRTTARLRPGMQALIGVTGHAKPETLTARNIAFSLAPMINAAGRLEKPSLAFDLMVTDNLERAWELAEELNSINQARRELDKELVDKIVSDIEQDVTHTADPFLVLADKAFHHGITGIVAGRLKERFRKPVLLLSYHEDEVWKGSGRSLDGCHLYDALAHCQDLLLGFGGHAQAAGCSVRSEHVAALRDRLNTFLRDQAWQPPADVVWLDAVPAIGEYTPQLLAELEQFEPCGQANPAPLLGMVNAHVLQTRTDRSGKHLFLNVDDGDLITEMVAWGKGEEWKNVGPWVNVLVRPKLKTWKGETKLELAIDRLEKAEPVAPAAQAPVVTIAQAGMAITDHRDARDRLRVLREAIKAGGRIAIYTGDQLPGLELDRAIGQADVTYWSDHHPGYGTVDTLICWERPYSLDAWFQLSGGVTGSVHLLWDGPVMEPELNGEWLQSFYRELVGLRHLTWPQLLARPWPATTLMVRSALDMLRECGLLAVSGQSWELLAAPLEPIDVAALTCYRPYREAREFRLLLANGSRQDVQTALTQGRARILVG